MAYIIYICPSIPPYGIRVDKKYVFGNDEKGYFYSSDNNKKYISIEELRMLFTPIDTDWDSLLDKKLEKTDKKTIKK